MKNILTKIVNIGIDESTNRDEIKYIRLANCFATIIPLFVLFAYIPLYIPYLPQTAYLLLIAILYGFLTPISLIFGFYKLYLFGRLFAISIEFIPFILVPLLIGRESNFHIYLFHAIFGAFFIFPRKEKAFMYSIILLLCCAYLGIEIWFINHNAIIDISQDFISVFKIFNAVGLLVYVLAVAIYVYYIYQHAETQIEEEREKAENLLLNILPEPIAKRLKTKPGPIADYFESAAILFADIVKFTELSEHMIAKDLVALLDEIFTEFDSLAEKYGLEKIKTIGDAYMVVGGIPKPKPNYLRAIADMAIEMQAITQNKFGDLKLRIGINTGPAVAGVIGRRKFSYDLWGDSVNTASRMESQGVSGKIQVSREVYTQLRPDYQFEFRGEIDIKGKGLMGTYFLIGKNS